MIRNVKRACHAEGPELISRGIDPRSGQHGQNHPRRGAEDLVPSTKLRRCRRVQRFCKWGFQTETKPVFFHRLQKAQTESQYLHFPMLCRPVHPEGCSTKTQHPAPRSTSPKPSAASLLPCSAAPRGARTHLEQLALSLAANMSTLAQND